MQPTHDVPTQILVAAVDTAATHGIARLSVGDVARRAGLSRQTLYRHFPSKDVLVAAAVAREADLIVDRVMLAATPIEGVRGALRAAILEALTATREHPLLDRLLRTEPESLLPLLLGDGPIIRRIRETAESIIGEKLPSLPLERRRQLGDLIARLIMSYAVVLADDRPDDIADTVSAFLVDGLLAEQAAT